jgi:signal transduction histidine kinase
MLKTYFNWKTLLIIIAIVISIIALRYANILTKELAQEERKKMELMGQAIESASKSTSDNEVTLSSSIISSNTTIPLINVDEKGTVLDFNFLDEKKSKDTTYLKQKLAEFKLQHKPIEIKIDETQKQYVYYGESNLLKQLRYFPKVLLGILFMFLLLVLATVSSSYKLVQNKLWVGMSKETAHQLGTPLSSLEGWMELIKDCNSPEIIQDMTKDIDRLKLVADRFSKIGSTPLLVHENILERLQHMVTYMQKRSSKNVQIALHCTREQVEILVSGALFDWVIENLIRNALDAIEGKGTINVTVTDNLSYVTIDVKDSGKGILKSNFGKVFKPGFSTKKRGWGLGLSLSKRIIDEYHHGKLIVQQSDSTGTMFRIILKR